jgi:hypothetical protein
MYDKKCEHCGEPLRFLKTAKGKNAPCEAEPYVRDGSDPLPAGKYYDWRGNLYNQDDVPCKTQVFRSHWGDCPGAAEARKRKEGNPCAS